MSRQKADPGIELIKTPDGEVTLLIDNVQAMQGWERNLMWRSADLLADQGGDFLEVGLGLGLSALRFASNPKIRSHTVVEKYPKVIELFHREHPSPPQALKIVNADIFEYARQLPSDAYDGIFFDPELPRAMFEDRSLMDEFMPHIVRALKPGAGFIPMFSMAGSLPSAATATAPAAVMLERYLRFFDRVVVEKHPYTAYKDTEYAPATQGDAFILCFYKGANPTPAPRS